MDYQSINRHFETPKDFEIEDIRAEDQGDSERSNEHTIDGGSLDDGEIQDVNDTSEEIDIVNGGETEVYNIDDAKFSEQEDNNVLYGGSISWESLEKYHKVRWRSYITATTLSLWVVLTIVGLIIYANTGNYTLLIFSPSTMMGVALYIVLFKLLRYYFGS